MSEYSDIVSDGKMDPRWSRQTNLKDIPHPAKPQWQGLTDEEIHDCFQNRGRGSDGLKTRKMIAAAIEAMLKEKNT